VTEPDPRDEPALRPARTRHRQSAAALSVSTWLGAVRRPSRRGLMVGGGAVVLAVLLVLGYVVWNAGDSTVSKPPVAAPGGQPAPSGSTAPGGGSPGPSVSATPGRTTTPPGRTTTPPGRATPPDDDETPDERPEPRLVGPKDLDGFTRLLGEFCEDRGDRTAVLLDGPGRNRRTGNWACVRIVTLTEINLDEACRKSFGEQSQARQLKRRDSRTWRCFDS
jgi:hypothetical protein